MPTLSKANTLSTSTDSDLILETKNLLGLERDALHLFLQNLAEIDFRRIYAVAGYPSLFKYLVEEFNLSESSAAMRIVVSRAVKNCPNLLEEIKSGRLHLSGAYLLCKSVKGKDLTSWLDKVRFKSKTEIECLLKTNNLFSQSRREYIKPVLILGQKTNGPELNSPQKQSMLFEVTSNTPINKVIDGPTPVTQATEEAFDSSKAPQEKSQDFEIRIGITVKKEVYDNIKKLQRLTGKDKVSDVVEKAIQYYIESIDPEIKTERRKMREEKKAKIREINTLPTFPETVRAKEESSETKPSRYIHQKIKDDVYLRDGGRCTFVTAEGKRCEARYHLEYDHLLPFAKGGEGTANNLVLKCRAHNLLSAEKEFGAEFMRRYQLS